MQREIIVSLRSAAMLAVLAGAASALAQAPTPIVPAGTNIFGEPNTGPGAYPTTLSASTWFIGLPANTVNGRFGSNAVRVNRIVSGPLKWTTGNINEGDIDIGISPGAPDDPRSYPTFAGYDAFRENDFVSLSSNPLPASIPLPASQWPDTENWGRLRLTGGRANAPANFAWGVHPARGVLIATVANLGRDNSNVDRFDRITPLGLTYGHAHVTDDGGDSTGRAYSPITGEFRGTGLYISAYVIGDRPGEQDEFVTDISAAYFPYAEGWVGGFYDPSTSNWRARGGDVSASPSLIGNAATVVTPLSPTLFAQYRITLPGVTPADGMLFAQNANDTNESHTMGVLPTDTGWDLAERFDESEDTGFGAPFAFDDSDSRFTFVFVPWSANNLVAGHVKIIDGIAFLDRAAGGATVERLAAGRYAITIAGKNADTGALLVHGAGGLANDPTTPDNTFFNYTYDAQLGKFVVQSRVLTLGNNTWGEAYPLRDSAFYFMYVDFTTPASLTASCRADYNGDGNLDPDDLSDYIACFFSVPPCDRADYDGNTFVDPDDLSTYISDFFAGCN